VREISVKGRNLSEGVPPASLDSNEILEALQEPLQGIVGAVQTSDSRNAPERGRRLAGAASCSPDGGALLRDVE